MNQNGSKLLKMSQNKFSIERMALIKFSSLSKGDTHILAKKSLWMVTMEFSRVPRIVQKGGSAHNNYCKSAKCTKSARSVL